ncbi:MAG: hypothetical protein ACSHXK_08245 [Oceanococcus sp.]
MNSKRFLQVLSTSTCALALAACGSSDSSSDSNLSAAANAAKQALLGTWTGACQDLSSGNNSTSSQQSIAYTTTQITISEATFNDNGSCSGTADFTEATRASYVVGNANATSTNVGGFPIDLTLPSGSVLLSIFRIEQNDTVLLVGNGDGPKDDDGRESTLNPAPFMKDGAATPSTTPAPTAAPNDGGRAAALEGLQGAWFSSCQDLGGPSARVRFTFNGTRQTNDTDFYSDSQDCSTSPNADFSSSQPANIVVGDAVTTSGGMSARAIDINADSGEQNLSIFLIDENGTRLFIGDSEGAKDADGRDSQLNFDLPFTAGTPPAVQ